jgi:hypothetical protein
MQVARRQRKPDREQHQAIRPAKTARRDLGFDMVSASRFQFQRH